MKNKDFFYLQYDKINWPNQEKTKINSLVNNYIIDEIIRNNTKEEIKLFDIWFGIWFFIRMIQEKVEKNWRKIKIEWCEPSEKNYKYFQSQKWNGNIKIYNSTFLKTDNQNKFDFLTAIYVFPHFIQEELEETIMKINSMLEKNGQFILVVANEKYIENKLESMRDLFIEKIFIELDWKKYKEVLHYSDIPEIWKVIDYNREESLYLDLFTKHWFDLYKKDNLDDNWFICTVFIFEKK